MVFCKNFSINVLWCVHGMQDVIRKDWMFKLVGHEDFKLDSTPCRVRIDPFGLFAYRYSLEVNGKPFRKFVERQSKILKTWTTKAPNGNKSRVVLGKIEFRNNATNLC